MVAVWYALRLFIRRLGRDAQLTAALAVLALCFATGAAVLDMVDAVLLRPLPYPDADELLMLWGQRKDQPQLSRSLATPRDVMEWGARQRSFTELCAFELWADTPGAYIDIVGADRSERVRGAFLTPNCFGLLGVEAIQGTVFSADSASDAESDVVVLGHRLWQNRFGGDPNVIGRSLHIASGLRRRPHDVTVIGVLPVDVKFTYPEDTEIFAPLSWHEIQKQNVSFLSYRVLARLRPGVASHEAQSNMTEVAEAVARTFPAETYRADETVRLESINDHVLGSARRWLGITTSAATGLMLIGAINAGTLLLSVGVRQRRELAIRTAVGATSRQLITGGLVRTTILAVMAAALALAASTVLTPLFRSFTPAAVPRAFEPARVHLVFSGILLGSLVLGGVIGAVTGAAGILKVPLDALKQLDFGQTGARVSYWRFGLVFFEVAITVTLAIGAAVLLAELWRLRTTKLGYDAAGVTVFELRLLHPNYNNRAHLQSFHRNMLDRLRALPGVVQAASTSAAPFSGRDPKWQVNVRETAADNAARHFVSGRVVDSEYFALMRIPIVRGRAFSAHDSPTSNPVAVISESLAASLFPGQEAIGRFVSYGRPYEIVGVVGDVRETRLDEYAPTLYLPFSQIPNSVIFLTIRSSQDGASARRVSTVLQSMDPMQPVERTTSLSELVKSSIATQTFYTLVTVAFAAVAFVVSVSGVYSIVLHNVLDRARELGVMLALGAPAKALFWRVASRVVRPLVAGVIVGIGGGWSFARFVSSLSQDPIEVDVQSVAAVIAIVLAVALVASCVPVVRFLRSSPLRLLRGE